MEKPLKGVQTMRSSDPSPGRHPTWTRWLRSGAALLAIGMVAIGSTPQQAISRTSLAAARPAAAANRLVGEQVTLASLADRSDWVAVLTRAEDLVDTCFGRLPATARGARAFSAQMDDDGGVQVDFVLGAGRGERQFVCHITEQERQMGGISFAGERDRGSFRPAQPPYFTTDPLARPIPGLVKRDVIGDFNNPVGVLFEKQ